MFHNTSKQSLGDRKVINDVSDDNFGTFLIIKCLFTWAVDATTAISILSMRAQQLLTAK